MAHFAELDENNIVIRVLVFSDTDIANNGGEYTAQSEQWIIDSGTPFLSAENSYTGKAGVKWKQTSYNSYEGTHSSGDNSKCKRFRYAGIGSVYDESRDAFIPEKIYTTWVWNESGLKWDPPVERPNVETIEVDGETVPLYFDWSDEKITWKGTNQDGSMVKYWNPNTGSWEDDYNGS